MELDRNDLLMYSSAMDSLTIFIFTEMELRNYDPQQKKLVQNLFTQVVDRAKNEFPRPEMTVAIMDIQPVLSHLIKATGESGD